MESLNETVGSPAASGELEADAPPRQLEGGARRLVTILAAGLSLYSLYWVVGVVEANVYRAGFLLVALALTFLVYPSSPARRGRVGPGDWLMVALAVVALGWPLLDATALPYRAATPTRVDVVLGAITILLVLEATWRTVGWILPTTAVGFLLYAHLGSLLELVGLGVIAHRGYELERVIAMLYMTLEGIFGIPLDVASTYIILFTLFGAVLEHSGAGRFFIEWALAALGRSGGGAGPGRAVTLAGFLLGTVSGSGVATTATLGSICWPLLRRTGYTPEMAGALLAAAGIGALLSPPTLGAAAFLIAEFLEISYLQVLIMATVPMLLYYLSIALMVEADARRLGITAAAPSTTRLGEITRQGGHHFLPLMAFTVLLMLGVSAFRAVVWATLFTALLSFLRRETALGPERLLRALEAGGRGILPIAATTATAGIIVGVVTLTGLGLKLAGLIVALAGGSVFFTVAFSALAVWILGLAVPVTASYIIGAIMIAPALTEVGVPAVAAHMFIFYYAVLSEVSPPTALAPFAAAAITGGNPFRTMMRTWQYTMPAFLVPFAFCTSPEGLGILLQAPLEDVVRATVTAVAGVAGVAAGMGGWIWRSANGGERLLAITGGLLLLSAQHGLDLVGISLLIVSAAAHAFRTARSARLARA